MKIDRHYMKNAALDRIFLLKRDNERFLKWENLIFWKSAREFTEDNPVRILLSIGLIFFIVITALIFLFQWNQYQFLENEAIIAVAEIIDKNSASVSLNGSNYTNYYLSYQYDYGTESHRSNTQVSQSVYNAAVIGTRSDVLFIPANRSVVTDSIDGIKMISFFTLGVLLLGIGFALYFYYSWYRKALLIPAKILEIESFEKHSDKGVHEMYRIAYEFSSPKSKKSIKGSTTHPIAPTSEEFLAIFYLNDQDVVAL
jgi:hypothetical protein